MMICMRSIIYGIDSLVDIDIIMHIQNIFFKGKHYCGWLLWAKISEGYEFKSDLISLKVWYMICADKLNWS